MDSQIGHTHTQTVFNKHRSIEIIVYILSDHNGMKLEFDGRRNYRTDPQSQKLNSLLLSDERISKEIKK